MCPEKLKVNKFFSKIQNLVFILSYFLHTISFFLFSSLSILQSYLQEIADMERYIERVKKSIANKEPPLKVAETRLSKRTKVELHNPLDRLTTFPLLLSP